MRRASELTTPVWRASVESQRECGENLTKINGTSAPHLLRPWLLELSLLLFVPWDRPKDHGACDSTRGLGEKVDLPVSKG